MPVWLGKVPSTKEVLLIGSRAFCLFARGPGGVKSVVGRCREAAPSRVCVRKKSYHGRFLPRNPRRALRPRASLRAGHPGARCLLVTRDEGHGRSHSRRGHDPAGAGRLPGPSDKPGHQRHRIDHRHGDKGTGNSAPRETGATSTQRPRIPMIPCSASPGCLRGTRPCRMKVKMKYFLRLPKAFSKTAAVSLASKAPFMSLS